MTFRLSIGKCKPWLLSIFFIINLSQILAQEKADTLRKRYDTLEPRKYSLQDFRDNFKPTNQQLQNTLEDFQFYNPLIRNHLFNFSTGNLGGASFSPTLKTDSTTGFRSGFTSLDVWNILPQKLNLLQTQVPFTRVKYVFGSKKENFILADHAQSFGKYISAGFTFKRISSEGFYTNGKNTSSDFNIYLTANSRNFRYQALAAFFAGNNKNQENGGVNISGTEQSNLEPVNLLEGKTTWKRSSYIYSHAYNLGKSLDSIKIDSFITRPIYSFRIGHEFEYSNNKFQFTNPNEDSAFFPIRIQDSITRDSSQIKSIENRFFISQENNQLFIRKWSLGVKNTINYWQQEIFNYTNIANSLSGNAQIGFTKFLYLETYGQFEITGYNQDDFSLKPSLSINFGKDSLQKATIRTGLLLTSQTPNYIFSTWESSHYKWNNNDLNKIQTLRIDASLSLPKQRFTINFNIKTIRNFTYFDSIANPTQIAQQLTILEFNLHKLFRFGKWGYYITPQLQKISNQEVLPLPSFYGRTGMFFESWVFKKAMLMRIGSDFMYCSPFKGFSYTPELAQFYLNSFGNLGNQYILDIYLSARVKRSSFFLKYERLNGIWDNRPVYAIANYPFPNGSLKFGINWVFMDYLPKKD